MKTTSTNTSVLVLITSLIPLKAGEMKTVNVIIKADVQGSVEALAASLLKIDVEGVVLMLFTQQ